MSLTQMSALQAIDKAIIFIKDAISAHRYMTEDDLMRYNLPYAFHPTLIPNRDILLNRNYKPVGSCCVSGFPHVDYEAFPNLHVQLTQKKIQSVAISNVEGLYYLFDDLLWDSKAAGKEYLKRLIKLRGMLV